MIIQYHQRKETIKVKKNIRHTQKKAWETKYKLFFYKITGINILCKYMYVNTFSK